MQPGSRAFTRCVVCGFGAVHTDEVIDRGVVFLAECPRCEHRWTSDAPLAEGPARVVRLTAQPAGAREVATAA